ncbi:hypothetical protein [Streptosporangium sp. NPDC002721]|uniref:hypothetical protein n=1 Tax=Streptosporangium sp. NPDC002721 TaxID=3366188 RepID=UPI0036AE569B
MKKVARELVAAAQRWTARRFRTAQPDQTWQHRAWSYYDNTPEVRFAATWIGNAMGKARLFAGARDKDGTVTPLPDSHRASELVASVAGGPAGQSELLSGFGPHLVVAGEGWIVIRPIEDSRTGQVRGEDWRVLSVLEMSSKGQSLEAEIDGDLVEIPPHDPSKPDDPMAPVAIRVWDAHPRRHIEADSPIRSSLTLLEELRLLNAAVAAIARSRLTGRGVLLVPHGTRFPTKGGATLDGEEDDLLEVFMQVAETAYKDPESAAAAVPIILEVPADAIGKIERLTFESNFDDLAMRLREETIRRFATGLDTPAEILLGTGEVNHWCTVGAVEIMTVAGWKTYDQLTVGELVLTLNHETGLSEWQPLVAVNTWDVVNKPMITIKGRRHTSITTANHHWPLLTGRTRSRTWTTSGELAAAAHRDGPDTQRQEYLILSAPHANLPTEPKYSDALVEVVAWYFTEGTAGVRHGRNTPKVSIYQSHHINPDNCDRITRALTALFGPASDTLDKGGRYASPDSVARREEAKRLRAENPKMTNVDIARQLGVSKTMVGKYLTNDSKTRDAVPRWRITIPSNRRLTQFRLNSAAAELILEHAPGRIVTLDFIHSLTAAQLELFIDTAVRGDGHYMHGKTPVFGQKDPSMCDAFELALILSGRSSYRSKHTTFGASADGPREKTQHMVVGSDRTTFAPRGRSFTEESYTGTIWCPTTPNGTWLARHEGTVFYTGNSGWQLKEEAITLAVEPRLGTIADALTTQWLRPILEDEGVADAGEVLVWYDSSTLRVRANRPQTALEVHDRGAISDAALRRETGFDDDDAPDQEELAARRQRNGLGENPAGQEQLPVDESQAMPDMLPAAATPPPEGNRVAATAWMGARGRELAEQLKAQHGLSDEELSDLLYAMVLLRAEARHGG